MGLSCPWPPQGPALTCRCPPASVHVDKKNVIKMYLRRPFYFLVFGRVITHDKLATEEKVCFNYYIVSKIKELFVLLVDCL